MRLTSMFTEEPIEITRLKKFIDARKEQPDNSPLKKSDLFEICQFLNNESKLSFITDTKMLFLQKTGKPNFIDNVNQFNKHNLFSKELAEVLFDLNQEESEQIYTLLHHKLCITDSMVLPIIAVLKKVGINNNYFYELAGWLERNNRFNEQNLRWISECHAKSIIGINEVVNSYKSELTDKLSLINDEVFQLILQLSASAKENDKTFALNRLLVFLFQLDCDDIKVVLQGLMACDVKNYYSIEECLNILKENGIQCTHAPELIYFIKIVNISIFNTILEVLAKHNLLQSNQKFITDFPIDATYSDLSDFKETIKEVAHQFGLTQTILDAALYLLKEKNKTIHAIIIKYNACLNQINKLSNLKQQTQDIALVLLKNENHNRTELLEYFVETVIYLAQINTQSELLLSTVFTQILAGNFTLSEILKEFNASHCVIDGEELLQVLSLSPSNMSRLAYIVQDLNAANLLDRHTLNKAIQVITTKLPEVNSAIVEETSRKDTQQKRSKVTLNTNFSFYVDDNESDDCMRGGFGVVKKGYQEEKAVKNENPVVAIKQIYIPNDLKPGYEDDCQMAKREVKYNLLLNRQAFYYSRCIENNNSRVVQQFIVAEWKSKMPLNDYESTVLKKYTIEKRLRWVISVLTELNVLHGKYRVHGDIKPSNVMLDVDKDILNFIDFGSSR